MKQIARTIIVAVLAWQVRRLHRKYQFRTICVVGSIGKTSTKLSIAKLLGSSMRVQYQDGNYNDLVSVPLVYFGQRLPGLLNPFAWFKAIIKNEFILARGYPYDVVVLEIGTDRKGDIAAFKKYVHSDIAVITAIAPEHMEYFGTIDAVAKEEFAVSNYADKLVINNDLVGARYIDEFAKNSKVTTYGIRKGSTYTLKVNKIEASGTEFQLTTSNSSSVSGKHWSFAKSQLYSLTAAMSVGSMLGLNMEQLQSGIARITPISGRMQLLQGKKQTVLIDDTYNASPDAVIMALQTLYDHPSSQKIAVLGAMNELGDFSQAAHESVGDACDPRLLALVVTLGPDANKWLAPRARARGCTVISVVHPEQAATAVLDIVEPKAVILAKGSQNNVYAEEVVKLLLHNKADASKLVRQSPEWLRIKAKNFATVPPQQ